MARAELEQAIKDLGLTVKADFVPWSKSRNAKPAAKTTEYSLNWRVTLQKDGHDILTTDYSAGIAHCPGYKQGERWTNDYTEVIRFECQTGKPGRWHSSLDQVGARAGHAPILPDPCDVISSLSMDSDVLTCGSFEEWASNYGYDTDSRKAEATYNACMAIALKFVNGLGADAVKRIQTACQDY